MSQVVQIMCVGIGGLVLAIIVIRLVALFLEYRAQKNDPLRHLRGMSREEIRQFLTTPVYDPPPKTRSRSKNKPSGQKPQDQP